MTSTAIRVRLYDYIRIADDKKLKAIYNILEDDITERVEWWKDKAFTDELDKEYNDWKKGKDKGVTRAEFHDSLAAMKQKRKK